MTLSLIVEILLSVLTLAEAFCEVAEFSGNMIAFTDWWLITWSIGQSIDQKALFRAIFNVDSANSCATLLSASPTSPKPMF